MSTGSSAPVYLFQQDWESRYSPAALRSWHNDHTSIPFIGTFFFVVMISVLPRVMRLSKPFELRPLLILWNSGLALFSLAASVRMWQFVSRDLASFSAADYKRSVCSIGDDPVSAFWMSAYSLSKIVQFGDTALLILRKRPTSLLHLWHHGCVLIFMWIQFATGAPQLKYFMLMNVIIHAVMYGYYALQAAGIRIPTRIAMTITAVQILQMIAGLWTTAAPYYYASQGETSCFRNTWAAASALLVYGSCLYLFSEFFVDKYLRTPATKRPAIDVNQNRVSSGGKKRE